MEIEFIFDRIMVIFGSFFALKGIIIFSIVLKASFQIL